MFASTRTPYPLLYPVSRRRHLILSPRLAYSSPSSRITPHYSTPCHATPHERHETPLCPDAVLCTMWCQWCTPRIPRMHFNAPGRPDNFSPHLDVAQPALLLPSTKHPAHRSYPHRLDVLDCRCPWSSRCITIVTCPTLSKICPHKCPHVRHCPSAPPPSSTSPPSSTTLSSLTSPLTAVLPHAACSTHRASITPTAWPWRRAAHSQPSPCTRPCPPSSFTLLRLAPLHTAAS